MKNFWRDVFVCVVSSAIVEYFLPKKPEAKRKLKKLKKRFRQLESQKALN